ncbi:transcription factor MYBS3-like [Aristolochia californica]|uniref:transcription factor MYBS3-like n=1 Tax=Aristolochia californica TaxID=171875 RepID=UPI0035D75C5C
MGRKCSYCGNNGHNSRTCGGYRGTFTGLRLFGVQLDEASPMKKSFSMDSLPSSSSSSSSSFSRLSVDESSGKLGNGYLSDCPICRPIERKKGIPWTEEEHKTFLTGLEKFGKGDWKGISRNFVTTRTPTQVASHAQKYFLRRSCLSKKKRRSSLFDLVRSDSEVHKNAAFISREPSFSCEMPLAAQSSYKTINRENLEGTGSIDLNSSDNEAQLGSGNHIQSPSCLYLMPAWPSCGSSGSPSTGFISQPSSLITPPDPPNLELTIAAPRSLDHSDSTHSSVLDGPITVTRRLISQFRRI